MNQAQAILEIFLRAEFTRHAEMEIYHLGEGDRVSQSAGQDTARAAGTGESGQKGGRGEEQIGGRDEL
eukprot:1152755-Pelagomonas_calceolata.AAC.2